MAVSNPRDRLHSTAQHGVRYRSTSSAEQYSMHPHGSGTVERIGAQNKRFVK
jgi:hypothetical protein